MLHLALRPSATPLYIAPHLLQVWQQGRRHCAPAGVGTRCRQRGGADARQHQVWAGAAVGCLPDSGPPATSNPSFPSHLPHISLTTGSIGAPESTLELEVRFASLAELEAFWSAIPQQQHRAWGQRMQQYIVHGSPQWSVYRCLPAFPVGSPTTAGAAAAGSSASLSGAMAPSSSAGAGSFTGLLQMPSEAEVGRYAADAPPTLPSTQQQTASGLSIVSGDEEAQVVLDWKGDPMKVGGVEWGGMRRRRALSTWQWWCWMVEKPMQATVQQLDPH